MERANYICASGLPQVDKCRTARARQRNAPAGRPSCGLSSLCVQMMSFAGRPELVRIEDAGGQLYGIDEHGWWPLYRYAPLQAAVLSGQDVPYAHLWPEHLKLFIYKYLPVPALAPEQVPPALVERFGAVTRSPGGLRPWIQATYKGWPLYLYDQDEAGSPVRGVVPALFCAVDTGVRSLAPPRERRCGP